MNYSEALPLSESLEDYLEAIYRVVQEKQVARPKDIAKRMNVSNASVTGALRALAERGLIHYAPYDLVTFTPEGVAAAEEINRRHIHIKEFLIDFLHVEAKVADETACRMEHAMSGEIVDKFVRFATFLRSCPRGGEHWIDAFERQCDQDSSCADCGQCVTLALDRLHKNQEEFLKGEGNAQPENQSSGA
ncbi:MAG: metal-dependent transcriptional regulator [Planctomycetia bacterium]|nr:metal-dependent transcriptional regulator [Planctomycetia bacterium]